MKELEDGTRTAELKAEQEMLETNVAEKEQASQDIQKEQIRLGGVVEAAERDIRDLKTKLDELTTGFAENKELTEEVAAEIAKRTEPAYRQSVKAQFDRLAERETELADERTIARNRFNREYPAYGFTGVEHSNEVYDQVLERCRKDFEPKYKEEFRKQYELVYHSLRGQCDRNHTRGDQGGLPTQERHQPDALKDPFLRQYLPDRYPSGEE